MRVRIAFVNAYKHYFAEKMLFAEFAFWGKFCAEIALSFRYKER